MKEYGILGLPVSQRYKHQIAKWQKKKVRYAAYGIQMMNYSKPTVATNYGQTGTISTGDVGRAWTKTIDKAENWIGKMF